MKALTFEELKRLIKEWSDIETENVTEDTELDALGFESKALATLLIVIQEDYGLEVEPSDLAEIRTVGDLYRVFLVKAP